MAKEQASGCRLGVIELFEGVAEIFLSRYLNALEHFQNAEKILLECRAYKRTLAASENIASCYAYLQMHDKARKQYEKTLLEAKRMKRKDIECICYINLCNIQFKNGDFKQALYYGECVTDKGDSIHYIAMAWSYYFMGDIDQCRKYQNILLNFDDMYIKLMVELLNLYILDSESKKKIVLLEKMMEYSEKQECHNDVLWCINFLIEEYRIIGNYRKVSDLQRLILGNLGYRSLFDKLNNVGG